MSCKPEPDHNYLLAALSGDVQKRLFPYLELVPLPLRAVLYECGQPMRHVYFPADSVISVQYLMTDGASTAISVVGNEGLLGASLCMADIECTRSRAVVQSAGHAFRLPRRRVKEEFDRHGELHHLMLRYTQALLEQVSQTAVCNRNHHVSQRLCCWLLTSMDRLHDNHLTMTQDFIANMLGVRREAVTEAALNLQRRGVIAYRRGLIEVLDRPKLEELSCECYRVVRDEINLVLNLQPRHRVIRNPEFVASAVL